jgi:hypothetical protein
MHRTIKVSGLCKEEWRQDRQDRLLHRDDGPAVFWSDGTQEWYRHGKRHRDSDQPALILTHQSKDKRKEWWVNGQLHRTEGPAIIWENGREKWFCQGKCHRIGGPAIKYEFGGEEWWLHNQLHREDGPAVIASDGTQMWYYHNQLHRAEGPAVIFPDGHTEWWTEGTRGPKGTEGSKLWCVNINSATE